MSDVGKMGENEVTEKKEREGDGNRYSAVTGSESILRVVFSSRHVPVVTFDTRDRYWSFSSSSMAA